MSANTQQIFEQKLFFTPLWRTIKNSGRGGSVQEDRL